MKENTIYYLSKIGGLWKKEEGEEFFFSEELLDWVDKTALYYIWNHKPDTNSSVNEKDVEKYVQKCIELGKKNNNESDIKYCFADGGAVFAVDRKGNEYYVLATMKLQHAKKGTINPDWMIYNALNEIEAKEHALGTIFTIKNSYTTMDEDYSYHFSIFNDGSLYVQQMESYCYEKTYTTIEKQKSEDFKSKALTIIKNFENEMSETWADWFDNKKPDGSIFYYDFSICKTNKFPFFKKMTKELKKLIDDYYPDEINWSISINNEYNGI